jgi:hypothetical protein
MGKRPPYVPHDSGPPGPVANRPDGTRWARWATVGLTGAVQGEPQVRPLPVSPGARAEPRDRVPAADPDPGSPRWAPAAHGDPPPPPV